MTEKRFKGRYRFPYWQIYDTVSEKKYPFRVFLKRDVVSLAELLNDVIMND